jgi:hypothetical protein
MLSLTVKRYMRDKAFNEGLRMKSRIAENKRNTLNKRSNENKENTFRQIFPILNFRLSAERKEIILCLRRQTD